MFSNNCLYQRKCVFSLSNYFYCYKLIFSLSNYFYFYKLIFSLSNYTYCYELIFSLSNYFYCYELILACGGVLHATNDLQYFHTPNYPSKYPSDKDCEWEIISPIGHSITLTFEDFQVEYHPSCELDHVELAEQMVNSEHTIATICGTQGLKKTYRTSGSRMFVMFRSDDEVAFKGFNASYRESMYSSYK